MGFLDKVKNMFTEEVEEDEVKVQQIKKEVKHVPIESPKGEKPISEEYGFNNMSFSKPVFFDEDDFEDLDLVDKKEKPKPKPKLEPKIEIKKKEPKQEEIKKMYTGNSVVEKEETKVFKPTPIISPVYGILDKNYHKEDIVDKTEASYIEPSEDKIDKVREKAYGTLEDELENTLFGNSILFKKEEEELDEDEVEIEEIDEDSISSLTEDVGKELDELLKNKKKNNSQKHKSKEKNKDLDKEKDEDEDLLGFIDSTLYKDGDEE